VKGWRLTPPEERLALWQGAQVRVRMGATVFSKDGVSAAWRQTVAAVASMRCRIPLPNFSL
jgi:hypothetical protein